MATIARPSLSIANQVLSLPSCCLFSVVTMHCPIVSVILLFFLYSNRSSSSSLSSSKNRLDNDKLCSSLLRSSSRGLFVPRETVVLPAFKSRSRCSRSFVRSYGSTTPLTRSLDDRAGSHNGPDAGRAGVGPSLPSVLADLSGFSPGAHSGLLISCIRSLLPKTKSCSDLVLRMGTLAAPRELLLPLLLFSFRLATMSAGGLRTFRAPVAWSWACAAVRFPRIDAGVARCTDFETASCFRRPKKSFFAGDELYPPFVVSPAILRRR